MCSPTYGKLWYVGEEESHHVTLLCSHPPERGAELDGAVPEHLVRVLTAGHPTHQGRQVAILVDVLKHKVRHVLLGDVHVRVGRPAAQHMYNVNVVSV